MLIPAQPRGLADTLESWRGAAGRGGSRSVGGGSARGAAGVSRV